MDFFKYDIKDNGAFSPFISTMEGAGADIEGSRVMFESDNSAAKMLAESLVEYEILTPVMEAGRKAAGGEISAPASKPAAAPKKAVTKKATVAKPAASAAPAVQSGEPGNSQVKQARKGKPTGNPAANGDGENAKAAGTPAVDGENAKAAPGNPKEVVVNEPAEKTPDANSAPENPSPRKQEVYQNIIEKIDSLGLDEGMVKAIEQKVTGFIDAKAEKAGDNASEYYAKLADNPANTAKLIFGVIQKADPELFEELKKSGKLNEKNENTASIAQKTELAKQISEIVGQIEVPDAFNVEVDDSEWENALITSCGYPMINLTSPLVRDMLRAPDPSQQKRAYKAFKKQLGADPDVAKALAIGIKGNLGVGGKQEDAKTDMNAKIGKTESVGTEGEVLVEGPLSAIKNAFLNPVEVLRGIAQNKGTACHRNNLVVMYDDIDGKSGEGNDLVKVVPLGVSSGVLVDLNKSVQVPMSHLAAFYSVVDPKVSFKSYAKAMAEVNKKNENVHTSMEGKARMLGKKLLSKVPLFGKGAKADLAAQDNSELMTAMGELAEYIQSNGHPPFYLLKPKSNPKEVDHWSDEKAANGYQMIIMNQNGHKAGIILKKSVAEALFKVG